MNGLLSRKRTWTTAQLAGTLAVKGLVMKPRTVRPQQDPARVAQVRTELDDLKKSRRRGTGTLLPRRNRLRPHPTPHLYLVPPPATALRPLRIPPRPARERARRPGRAGHPRVVVLDNASMHKSHTIRKAHAALRKQHIHLWYLPPYSPELNDIERTFRQAKHGAMPRRALPPPAHLVDALCYTV